MSKAVAICNQKGGVGKSTTAVNVGAYLAKSGRKTLLIDLDPQGNATVSCGVVRSQLDKTIYEVLIDGVSVDEALKSTSVELLELLPSSVDLAGAEVKLAQVSDRETTLKRTCEQVLGRYDVVLIDCPPSLGLLTVNALVAADLAVIPVQCEYLALEGLNTLMKAIRLIQEGPNPGLRVGGIVLTMVDLRANLTREVADEVRRFFKDLVFETQIPRNVRLAECPSFGKPICVYDPTCLGAISYEHLTKELSEKAFGLEALVREAVS